MRRNRHPPHLKGREIGNSLKLKCELKVYLALKTFIPSYMCSLGLYYARMNKGKKDGKDGDKKREEKMEGVKYLVIFRIKNPNFVVFQIDEVFPLSCRVLPLALMILKKIRFEVCFSHCHTT